MSINPIQIPTFGSNLRVITTNLNTQPWSLAAGYAHDFLNEWLEVRFGDGSTSNADVSEDALVESYKQVFLMIEEMLRDFSEQAAGNAPHEFAYDECILDRERASSGEIAGTSLLTAAELAQHVGQACTDIQVLLDAIRANQSNITRQQVLVLSDFFRRIENS